MRKLLFALACANVFAGNALAAAQYDFRVDGMTCQACVVEVTKALKGIDGVESVKVDLKQGIVKTCVKEGVTFTDTELTDLFLERGFTYRSMEKQEQCNL